LLPEIKVLDDADKYRAIHQSIVTATTVDEVRRACAAAMSPEKSRSKKRGAGGTRRSS
jgi:hypothetical protein